MAKVIITLEDAPDGVEISADFTPDLPPDLSEDDLDKLTEAQLLALDIIDSLDMDEEED